MGPRLFDIGIVLVTSGRADDHRSTHRMTRRDRSRPRGVFDRPDSARPGLRYVNDGGHDAPLSPRGRLIFSAAVFGIVGVFVILGVLVWLGR